VQETVSFVLAFFVLHLFVWDSSVRIVTGVQARQCRVRIIGREETILCWKMFIIALKPTG
jgi:hypothetical protein